MALSVKNERVSRLAQELAQLTGQSITEAVGSAIEARLTELRRQSSRDQVAQELMTLGKRCASQAPAEWRKRDFDDELYDERGLPN